jgi:hypothetical protein
MKIHFCLIFVLLAVVFTGVTTRANHSTGKQATAAADASACPVTIPRKSPVTDDSFPGANSAAWNGDLYVGLLWPSGTIIFRPGGAGFISSDGSMSMKIAWFRANGLTGRLTIDGKRLDAPAPPLRADVPSGYGDTGFQATALIFPAEGCWQVTGHVANESLTLVTKVIHLTGSAN